MLDTVCFTTVHLCIKKRPTRFVVKIEFRNFEANRIHRVVSFIFAIEKVQILIVKQLERHRNRLTIGYLS